MLTFGTFYVVTIGKRYLRFPYEGNSIIAARQLEHARRFPSKEEAIEQANLVREALDGDKSIGVRSITIEQVQGQ